MICMHAKLLQSCLTLCDPMDYSPLGSSSMGFSRQEYWSGLPSPPPGDLPGPGKEPESLPPPALADRFFTARATWEGPDDTKVKVAQSCLTLWDPMDYTVHGILQARIVEWVAVPFSRGSSQPGEWTQVSLTAGEFFTSWATREALMI